MLKNLLNIIYPKRCFWCMKKINENLTYTCEKCSNILEYRLNECLDVVMHDSYFDRLISCFLYKGEIREKILKFKFFNKPFLGKVFSKYIAYILKKKDISIDLIVPVPMYYMRYFVRGYNQSEILAKVISDEVGVRFSSNVLKKIRKSRVQSTLNAKDRKNNVMNTYSVNKKNEILGKSILLVDDIYTTGATVDECSKVLKENGAEKIIVVTIAHGNFSKEEI